MKLVIDRRTGGISLEWDAPEPEPKPMPADEWPRVSEYPRGPEPEPDTPDPGVKEDPDAYNVYRDMGMEDPRRDATPDRDQLDVMGRAEVIERYQVALLDYRRKLEEMRASHTEQRERLEAENAELRRNVRELKQTKESLQGTNARILEALHNAQEANRILSQHNMELSAALRGNKTTEPVSQPAQDPNDATGPHVASGGRAFENLTDNEFEERVKDVFDAMLDLLMSKRASYGPANLTTHGLQGILVRISDKIYRLQTMIDRDAYGSLDGDSMDDSFKDVIGYAVLGLIYSECERRDRFSKDSPG